MIDFGPAGSSDEIIEQKMSRAAQAEYLNELGITAYEYPFTFGVNMNDKTKEDMITYFKNQNFKLSVHAPYYINFASSEPDKVEKTFEYFNQTPNIDYLEWEDFKKAVGEQNALVTLDHVSHSPCCTVEKAKHLLGVEIKYSIMDIFYEYLNEQKIKNI